MNIHEMKTHEPYWNFISPVFIRFEYFPVNLANQCFPPLLALLDVEQKSAEGRQAKYLEIITLATSCEMSMNQTFHWLKFMD